jgi:hypothetical protein
VAGWRGEIRGIKCDAFWCFAGELMSALVGDVLSRETFLANFGRSLAQLSQKLTSWRKKTAPNWLKEGLAHRRWLYAYFYKQRNTSPRRISAQRRFFRGCLVPMRHTRARAHLYIIYIYIYILIDMDKRTKYHNIIQGLVACIACLPSFQHYARCLRFFQLILNEKYSRLR